VRENCIVLPRYERDANIADFGHSIGHDCVHCDAIREIGPALLKNPLVRLMGHAKGSVLPPSPKTKRELRNEARKSAGRRSLILAVGRKVIEENRAALVRMAKL
jgi:hypothetical protein